MARDTSYLGLVPASAHASSAARGASNKHDTSCELMLRKALSAKGLRYRLRSTLPGKPDVTFPRAKVAVFADGDFWHGKDLEQRISKLKRGHNAPYWVAKIGRNVERDRRINEQLTAMGWQVLRFWESEIRCSAEDVAECVAEHVLARSHAARRRG